MVLSTIRKEHYPYLHIIPSGSTPHQLSFQKGKNMNSPITGKPMKLIREADTLTFRKESFSIVYHYYLCEDSGERFTDDRQDTLNTVQATNQLEPLVGSVFQIANAPRTLFYAVSGAMGREKVHFQAPDSVQLPVEMERFLAWFNSDIAIDPMLKAAVAHLWFATIHPFEDGNGR